MIAVMSAVRTTTAFDALRAGDAFELLVEPVSTQQLVRYAGASDDYNRIHYDQPYAVDAGLGGIVAHGMLTMAFMARAAGEFAGEQGRVSRIAARFTAPVRPGDAVHVTGTLTGVLRDGRRGELECRLAADVGGRAVASGDATLVINLESA